MLYHDNLPLHDETIIGLVHDEAKQQLHLYLKNGGHFHFENVVYFETSGFSMQNVIFDVYRFTSRDFPDDLNKRFATLSFYRAQNDIHQVYHIDSSCGMELLIICE